MTSLTNHFKTRLTSAKPQFGLWQALANPYTAEICAGAGFDWLLFDGEHGPNTVTTLLAQLQAVAPYDVHPIARPPVGDPATIKQYLDIGFQTLLIPFVETAEQARDLVRAMKYPPAGIRGVGSGLARAARWNRLPGYLSLADSQTCLLVQIETAKGLSNLESIADVEGVDGVFVGAADLSAAFNYRGQSGHPDMLALVDSTISRIVRTGKAAGALSSEPTLAKHYATLGCRFIAVGIDVSLIVKSTSELAHSFITADMSEVEKDD